MTIAVCVKWVDLRPDIDALTGEVRGDARRQGFSDSDRAAFETALTLATGRGESVTLVTVAPSEAEPALRELAASGAGAIVRVETDLSADSAHVGRSLADAIASIDDATLVVCGDHSVDRGSGSVPAFIAHHLGWTQALGLVDVAAAPDSITAVRRLDGGRREHLRIDGPAVLSVEGSVARLRRAALSAVIAARSLSPTVRTAPSPTATVATVVRTEPIRPRARVFSAPKGDRALDRIVDLTGALVERTPPRRVDGRSGRRCRRDRRPAPRLGLFRLSSLGDLTWPEVKARSRTFLVVPLGSTEQHGPHLPLDTDTRIAVTAASRLAAARDDLVVAPAVAIGASGEHAGFDGTLSIGTAVFEEMIVELGRSADEFAGVIWCNAHGGNSAALYRADQRLRDEGRRSLVARCSFPGGDPHAGRTETSLLLAIAPDVVRLDLAAPGDERTWAEVEAEIIAGGVIAVSPSGVLGDPTGASAEEGEQLLADLVDRLLVAVARFAHD